MHVSKPVTHQYLTHIKLILTVLLIGMNTLKSIRKERLAECVLDNHSRDFWKEIKQLNHVGSSGTVAVDGISDSSMVANMFADKYQNLYNCVPFNIEEMDNILTSLNKKIDKLLSNNIQIQNLLCR